MSDAGKLCRLALLGLLSAAAPSRAEPPSAVVLMYHRVGEEDRFATSVSRAQFEAHLAELGSARYAVLPLAEILEAFDSGQELPARVVGLTLDDAYLSSYRQAWPRLRAAGLPFTLFLASDHIDQRLKAYMSWDQLRELAGSGLVSIGIQGASHGHMTELDAAAARADIARAVARVEAELGAPPPFFSYPYGEYGSALRDLVAGFGFRAAFGQHSGAFGPADDRFALPRFALDLQHGDLERLRRIAQALALRVTALRPGDPYLRGGRNPPAFGFTLVEPESPGAEVACYFEGRPTALRRPAERRIEVRLPGPLAPGRHRVNCTQPGPEGRWRWRGALFTVPR